MGGQVAPERMELVAISCISRNEIAVCAREVALQLRVHITGPEKKLCSLVMSAQQDNAIVIIGVL